MEDNRADLFLICEAIEVANLQAELHMVEDGERALQFFQQVESDESAPRPVLVILDINLPKKPGGQVLRWIRASRRCANTRVLVVTSSDSAQDRTAMAGLGANGYFHKPSEYEDFMKLGGVVKALLEE